MTTINQKFLDQQTELLNLFFRDKYKEIYGKEFELDQDNTAQYVQCLYYFSLNPKFKGDLNKGLFMMGDYGVGKTSMIKCFAECLKQVGRSFSVESFMDLDDDFEKFGYSCFDKHRVQSVRMYDDLGKESLKVNSMGSSESTALKVLEFRHRLFVEYGIKTIVTTNLNANGIIERYTDFIYGRVKESYNVLFFKKGAKCRR
jgi:hypothetical protein